VEAPIVSALAGLISGDMPLERWVEKVRTTTPPPARFARSQGFWRRRLEAVRTWWARVRTRPR
jgi:hypothetical protein